MKYIIPFLLIISTTIWAQSNAQRDIVPQPQSQFAVTLTTQLDNDIESYAIKEIIPWYATPSKISHNGYWNDQDRIIRWGSFLDNGSRSLTYSLTSVHDSIDLDGYISLNGNTQATTGEVEYTPPVLPTPTLDPPSGSFVPLDIQMTCDTPDAKIYYTTNGSKPDLSSSLYTVPIHLTQTTKLNIKAIKDGFRDSDIITVQYTEAPLPLAVASRQVKTDDTCSPTIEIRVSPQDHIETWAIEEFLSEGILPNNISDNGYWDAESQTIRWGTILDNTERRLSYQIQSEYVTHAIDFSGLVSFMGTTYDISGDTQTQIDCSSIIVQTPVFSPSDDIRAPVQVSINCDTPDALIYYTTDGSDPGETSILYTGTIDIIESTEIKAIAMKPGMQNSRIVQAHYQRYVDKAIIVTGGGPEDFLWDATINCANYAYCALMYRGYNKAQLHYLSANKSIDADDNGNPRDDIDEYATNLKLEDAITSWASDAKNLIVYLIDHGGPGTFLINENEVLNASDLNSWLNTAQSQIPGKIYIVYEACYSGSFLKELKFNSGAETGRIIITSASEEDAYFLLQGTMSFSYQFWAAIFDSPSVYNAFTQAMAMMQAYQTPLLDADGDGIGNEKKDSLITRDLIIGNERITASSRPKIILQQACILLNNKTSQTMITKDIVSLHPIQKVWAVISPPKSQSAATGNPILELPEIEMNETFEKGQFSGTYSDFSEKGVYTVSIYAQDSQGAISLPAIIHVFSGDISQWKGDINMDQIVDLSDVITGLQILSDISSIESCGSVVSCDGNDMIDIKDVLRILYLIGE